MVFYKPHMSRVVLIPLTRWKVAVWLLATSRVVLTPVSRDQKKGHRWCFWLSLCDVWGTKIFEWWSRFFFWAAVFWWKYISYPCCVFTLNLQDASTITSPWDCSGLEKSCSTSNHQEPQSSSSSFYLGRWYSSRVLVVTCIIMRGAPGLAKLGIESVKAVRKFGEMSKAWHNLTINQWIDIHRLF